MFHPRPEAHAIIAQLIVNDLVVQSQERHDGVALLVLIAAAGLGMIILLLALLLCLFKRRQRSGWQPAWLQDKKDRSYDGDEDEEVSQSVRDRVMSARQYNTFG